MDAMGLARLTVVVLGGGEMASGAVAALYRAGIRRVLICELEWPLAIRRAVAFAQAVFDGRSTVDKIPCVRVAGPDQAEAAWARGDVPVVVDPDGRLARAALGPDVLVDGRMAKRNLGTVIGDARLVVGLGPGFRAGEDVHAVVETARGHDLGRVAWQGSAKDDTGVPGEIGGQTFRRVVRATATGRWESAASIGCVVEEGRVVGRVAGEAARAGVAGVLRGVLMDGVEVQAGTKVADVDPRGGREACFTTSDKARLIGAGVLEAVLARFLAGRPVV